MSCYVMTKLPFVVSQSQENLVIIFEICWNWFILYVSSGFTEKKNSFKKEKQKDFTSEYGFSVIFFYIKHKKQMNY